MQVVIPRTPGSACLKKKEKKQPTKSALLDDMHWDVMMPPLEKKNEKYVLQINEIHIDHMVLFCLVALDHRGKSWQL